MVECGWERQKPLSRLFHFELAPKTIMAPQVGLEPTTLRLTAECSAIELLRSKIKLVGFSISDGREEDRTPDLRIANAALSQLSYTPKNEGASYLPTFGLSRTRPVKNLPFAAKAHR